MIFKTTLKQKKAIKGLKHWLAWKLVNLAEKIYPESDEVKEFMMSVMTEAIMKGSVVVSHKDFFK